ncbi:MAG TPA: bifunctional phosphopantothenoylcysteine decarboxylase/phosphopantothenate--cysteine ligase CoaBC [Solirubrobacterales bacterium]|jgi:phosphopantothenoylcysteine decarboxylase/phosphopantothenate--cysteine ligase|nr:bifunctional phosphopantothenoylcysteine decarboxylase/phosphopantothenate--cysteine ligase CoaBC [Solirubrobacterales bacterium]HMU27370.1 bifunctional phosphopantothenoylcysteine decarboxylase/phosphopantothenate--cysteine ligase CoaBC [Solirubrobacterales bacterium]HMX72045.1 bifunctional phosphopantothenoylcysteine decarboxylase/phosphopantothenate--cysteine ligase CoaBC [Solirubrobacterales bacterium]HMY25519.1 bifunctional phosphopantothenoylcysteine decarboxylase/phosphopantothenate--c
MAKILLGVSGGIAAYKAVEFVRLATGAGHSVRVLMTSAARKFVGPDTFEGILGAPVLTSEFERDPMRGTFPGEELPEHDPIGHLAVAESADVYLVAPASANTIAKLATGQADSILTTAFLAFEGPRLVAPAMNERMYLSGATQGNLSRLRQMGVEVIDPGVGRLASKGEAGVGRLPEPTELLERVEAALDEEKSADLEGLRVLVTAGGTREGIDPVRYIGNRSSGRMGLALAERARKRGAEVTVICANVNLPAPAGVRRVDVESTVDLARACREQFPAHDLLLMAAAPADFTVADTSNEKLSRTGGEFTLTLVPTEDILAGLAANRIDGQTVVGFAAQHGGDAIGRARQKLERKGADMIVLNDVSDRTIGFDSDENAVTLVTGSGEREIPKAPKTEIADRILDRAVELRAG